MEIKELKLKGVFEIKLNSNIDERGFFMRTFDYKIFQEAGLKYNWVQENHSLTLKKNTIRGLHLQLPPFSESKLVRCIKGKIFDVFVDLRKQSSTFGQWDALVISEDSLNSILIPRGFAHGFCTLTDNCEVIYKVDNYYSPSHEVGLLWNDEQLKIDWPAEKPQLSEKDNKNITLSEFIEKYKSIEE